MAERLACDRSDVVTEIVDLAGAVRDSRDPACSPSQRVAALVDHSEGDQAVRWNGGFRCSWRHMARAASDWTRVDYRLVAIARGRHSRRDVDHEVQRCLTCVEGRVGPRVRLDECVHSAVRPNLFARPAIRAYIALCRPQRGQTMSGLGCRTSVLLLHSMISSLPSVEVNGHDAPPKIRGTTQSSHGYSFVLRAEPTGRMQARCSSSTTSTR